MMKGLTHHAKINRGIRKANVVETADGSDDLILNGTQELTDRRRQSQKSMLRDFDGVEFLDAGLSRQQSSGPTDSCRNIHARATELMTLLPQPEDGQILGVK
jgi:hypothetical protein